jgi:hypothetical protein
MESCEDSCHLRSLGECRSMRCWLAQHWDFRTTCQDFFGVYGAILGRDLSGITPWFCVWGDYVTKSRSLFLVASGPDEAEDWQLVNRRDEPEVPSDAFPAINWGLARAGMELTLMTCFDVPMLLLTQGRKEAPWLLFFSTLFVFWRLPRLFYFLWFARLPRRGKRLHFECQSQTSHGSVRKVTHPRFDPVKHYEGECHLRHHE